MCVGLAGKRGDGAEANPEASPCQVAGMAILRGAYRMRVWSWFHGCVAVCVGLDRLEAKRALAGVLPPLGHGFIRCEVMAPEVMALAGTREVAISTALTSGEVC